MNIRTRNLNKCLAIVGLILIVQACVFGADITDPLADFLASFERNTGDKVYRLKCDIENNGGEAVFLAYSHDIDSDGDCGWTLYLKRNGVYIRATGINESGNIVDYLSPTFNIHRYVIGNIPELSQFGLLTSEVSLGRTGGTQLRAVVIIGNSFKMTNVGGFQSYVPTPTPTPGNGGSPTPTPTPAPSRFPNPPVPAIEELNP